MPTFEHKPKQVQYHPHQWHQVHPGHPQTTPGKNARKLAATDQTDSIRNFVVKTPGRAINLPSSINKVKINDLSGNLEQLHNAKEV